MDGVRACLGSGSQMVEIPTAKRTRLLLNAADRGNDMRYFSNEYWPATDEKRVVVAEDCVELEGVRYFCSDGM